MQPYCARGCPLNQSYLDLLWRTRRCEKLSDPPLALLSTPLSCHGRPLCGGHALVSVTVSFGQQNFLKLPISHCQLLVGLPSHADRIMRLFAFNHRLERRTMAHFLVDLTLLPRNSRVLSPILIYLCTYDPAALLPGAHILPEDERRPQVIKALAVSLQSANTPDCSQRLARLRLLFAQKGTG